MFLAAPAALLVIDLLLRPVAAAQITAAPAAARSGLQAVLLDAALDRMSGGEILPQLRTLIASRN